MTPGRRLPAIKKVAAEINKVRTGGKNTVAKSGAYLHSQSAELAKYGSVDGLVDARVNGDDRARAFVHHLIALRAELERHLWALGYFVGTSVLDDVLFRAVAVDAAPDPILRCLEVVRDRRLARPGMVIFPLHSLGLLGAVTWEYDRRGWAFSLPETQIAIFAQSNDWDRTLRNLDRTRKAFGIRKSLPIDLLVHWRKSAHLTWLENNPLLVLPVSTAPATRRDSEEMILERLKTASALACMLATLQPHHGQRQASAWNSAVINNHETLDIRHYINLFDHPEERRQLDGDCVAIHMRGAALAEISELNIEIDPRYWNRYRGAAERTREAVDVVYNGYMKHVMLSRPGNRITAHTVAFAKLYDAMSCFRRSFHESDQGWAASLSLATAFEMMLTDGLTRGKIADKLRRRVQLLLHGKRGVMKYSAAVHELYKARNSIIHAGVTEQLNIADAQRAFVLCFMELANRTAQLTPSTSEPMRTMTGDQGGPLTKNTACQMCGCTGRH